MMGEIAINPVIRDYEMDADGFAVTTNELKQAAQIRLRAHFGEWQYDTTLGSSMFRANESRLHDRNADVIRRAEQALQPLIDDGRASAVAIKILETSRYGVAIDVLITDARDQVLAQFQQFIPVG